MVFTKAAIIDEPEIFPATIDPQPPQNPKSNESIHPTHIAYENAQGDNGVIGFWKKGRTTIFDIRIVDPSNKTYQHQSSTTTLNQTKQHKKKK